MPDIQLLKSTDLSSEHGFTLDWESNSDLLKKVKTSCYWVTQQSQRVKISEQKLDEFIGRLESDVFHSNSLYHLVRYKKDAWAYDLENHYLCKDDCLETSKVRTFTYILVLAAINFGSGYAQFLHRQPKNSTYYTISRQLDKNFEREKLYDAQVLRTIEPTKVFHLLNQHYESTQENIQYRIEFSQKIANSLNELGHFVSTHHNSSFECLMKQFRDDHENRVQVNENRLVLSAKKIIKTLSALNTFNDVCEYKGRIIHFYKKAQLLAADLHRAGFERGWWEVRDVRSLTLFADNAVAQMLRVAGIINFEDARLASHVDSGKPLARCSEEEIEIRACSISSGGLLRNKIAKKFKDISIIEIDYFLWFVSHNSEYAHSNIRRHLTFSPYY